MKAYLRTFGCRANHYDSERVRALLAVAGVALAPTAAEADVAIFNGCAVTAEAEADLRQAVRRAARERPALRSVVMGCAAGTPHAGELRTLPTVDALVPGADFEALADALDLPADVRSATATLQSGTRALLRVQDGCDEHCTFCITTLARGANRSRPPAQVVEEAQRLAEWHRELVLTGVHIGSYGTDRGTSLGELLEVLVARVPEVRFRLSSVEATEVDARLAELLTGDPSRVAPHLHAPLQSGSDRVLRRMGRHWYTASAYADAVYRLCEGGAAFGLGADVITGFPGETAEDHAATVALVEQLPFTYLHVFPFSPRPGTAATRLPDAPVPQSVAGDRARELRALAARKAATYRTARVGGTADVIVVGSETRAGAREGVTEDYLTVRLGDPALPRGTRFQARLTLETGVLTAVGAGV